MHTHDRRTRRNRQRVRRRRPEFQRALTRAVGDNAGDSRHEGFARRSYQYGIAERAEVGQGGQQFQIMLRILGET